MTQHVEITLNGNAVTLRPTLAVAKAVNALGGGFQGAIFKIGALDFEMYAGIVAAGIGKKVSEVEDDVFREGLITLTVPLVEFVTLLASGGKPLNVPEGAA